MCDGTHGACWKLALQIWLPQTDFSRGRFWHINRPYNQMSSTHNERQGHCSSDGMWDNSKNGAGKSIMLSAAANKVPSRREAGQFYSFAQALENVRERSTITCSITCWPLPEGISWTTVRLVTCDPSSWWQASAMSLQKWSVSFASSSYLNNFQSVRNEAECCYLMLFNILEPHEASAGMLRQLSWLPQDDSSGSWSVSNLRESRDSWIRQGCCRKGKDQTTRPSAPENFRKLPSCERIEMPNLTGLQYLCEELDIRKLKSILQVADFQRKRSLDTDIKHSAAATSVGSATAFRDADWHRQTSYILLAKMGAKIMTKRLKPWWLPWQVSPLGKDVGDFGPQIQLEKDSSFGHWTDVAALQGLSMEELLRIKVDAADFLASRTSAPAPLAK